jgi:hypothetical protein
MYKRNDKGMSYILFNIKKITSILTKQNITDGKLIIRTTAAALIFRRSSR